MLSVSQETLKYLLTISISLVQASIEALNIVTEECHPSQVKGRGRSKEGFSVYSLLDRCRSGIGRFELHQWMMKPTMDIDVGYSSFLDITAKFFYSMYIPMRHTLWQVLNKRLDAIEQLIFMKSVEPNVLSNIAKTLSKVKSLIKSVARMKRATHRYCNLASSFDCVNCGTQDKISTAVTRIGFGYITRCKLPWRFAGH